MNLSLLAKRSYLFSFTVSRKDLGFFLCSFGRIPNFLLVSYCFPVWRSIFYIPLIPPLPKDLHYRKSFKQLILYSYLVKPAVFCVSQVPQIKRCSLSPALWEGLACRLCSRAPVLHYGRVRACTWAATTEQFCRATAICSQFHRWTSNSPSAARAGPCMSKETAIWAFSQWKGINQRIVSLLSNILCIK